jgi:hypothetical protein
MTDADLIRNMLSLFPTTEEVQAFRGFFTQVGMDDNSAWMFLAQVIKERRGNMTMPNVIDTFYDEAIRLRRFREMDLSEMVEHIIRDDSDTDAVDTPNGSEENVPTQPQTPSTRTFAQVIQGTLQVQSTLQVQDTPQTPKPIGSKHTIISNQVVRSSPVSVSITIEGLSLSSRYLENNCMFEFIRRSPTLPIKFCSRFPECSKGLECGFAHLKRHSAPGPFQGVPIVVKLEGAYIETNKLKPTKCFELMRRHPHMTIVRCLLYPKCHFGGTCTFAHCP